MSGRPSIVCKITHKPLELGFAYISKEYAHLFPSVEGPVKVVAILDGEEVELTYNSKYRRLHGLTEFYRRRNAEEGDMVKIEVLEPFKKYRLSFERAERKTPSWVPSHNEVRDMIHEIGKFEGRITEVEYPIDGYRLDVVWKKIKAGNPSHVFEVQMGGNLFEALTKLKHAWDKWNSKPILVTTDEYMEEAKRLLEGSFHEMERVAHIINWKKVRELHRLEKKVAEIRGEIGI